MTFKNRSVYIFTDEILRKRLSKNELFELIPPFFLLVKSGKMIIEGETEHTIEASTITVISKQEQFKLVALSEDCECILLQYNRQYVRTMTFQLNLLDAFKYVYANSQYTFNLPEEDFNDLWFLADYINRQLKVTENMDLEKHILRHLNYSFLYSAIEKMDRNNQFDSNPTNQKEKIVLKFFENLRDHATSKLKVSDYAQKQNVTARHFSAMVKEVTGMPALEIIHRMLLSRAKVELTTTNKPISEIALDLGFTDPYTFSHFFKKQTGMNPTDFRNNYQE
ncbi:MAG: helix-turn-helix domain-containing protein [Aequorivita sp.]